MISSAHINGSGYRELEAGEGLTSVAFAEDTMFWLTVGGKSFDINYCKISLGFVVP